MKINKERIRENSVKCKNTMQITLDDDFNVPDSKADIDSIIREWGNPHASIGFISARYLRRIHMRTA